MYNDIKLEKGLYSITGKTFTQALSELDDDSNYVNTELEGLDAYERQLKRFDIKVSGADSDRVEKFFKTTESAILFPEFVRRSIKQGMDEASVLGEIVAAKTYTDGIDYRGINVTVSDSANEVAEAGTFPETAVRLASDVLSLVKHGRRISTSYEVLRKQRLDVLSAILKSAGAQISKSVNLQAVNALKESVTPSVISGSTLTYSDVVNFWATLSDYNMTAMIVSPSTMAKILAFDEMKYCIGEYMTNGTVKTPYGVTLVKCSGLADDIAVGLDKTCALEMVFGSDIVVDFSKLSSTQIDEIVFSVTTGFVKICDDSVKVLDLTK